MTTNCLICSKEFRTYPSRLKMGYDKYCGKKCQNESQRGKTGYWIGKKRPDLKNTRSGKTMFRKGEAPIYTPPKRKIAISCVGCSISIMVAPSKLGRTKWCSKECRAINSPYSTRKTKCPECNTIYIQRRSKLCRSCSNMGELSPAWKGGITPEIKKIRTSDIYKAWRTVVFERDNYTCQGCNIRGGSLQADHLKSFAYYPELRFDVNNGRTLCIECHKKTPNYGYKAKLLEGGVAHELQSR